MIEFKPFVPEEKEIIDSFLKNSDACISDYNFTALYLWEPFYKPSWAIVENSLVLCMNYEKNPYFLMPVGDTPWEKVFERLQGHADEIGVPLSVRSLTKEQYIAVLEKFPDEFEISINEDISDYVYTAQSLADLSGKKLHAKRNHIHRFEDGGKWYTEPVTEENIELCIKFLDKWYDKNEESRGIRFDHEKRAFKIIFENFTRFGTEGLMLFQNDSLVAFTLGERMTKTTYLTHFEKADNDIQGAYAMINREFARFIIDKYPYITYINREDDMGLESMRRAKRSYYPTDLGVKYDLTKKA